MDKYTGIESKLFDWVSVEDADGDYCSYGTVTLRQQIGDFLEGTSFLGATINYDKAELELEDVEGGVHRFKCFLTIE